MAKTARKNIFGSNLPTKVKFAGAVARKPVGLSIEPEPAPASRAQVALKAQPVEELSAAPPPEQQSATLQTRSGAVVQSQQPPSSATAAKRRRSGNRQEAYVRRDGRKTVATTVHMDPKIRAKIRRLAIDRNVSMSELVMSYVAAGLEA